MPKTQNAWFKYMKTIRVQIGEHILNALEIEHGILRHSLNLPKIDENIRIVPLPKFQCNQYKHSLVLKEILNEKKLRLINFALFLPTK